MEPLPPEALLEHAAWLRRLASGLVRGDGDAEDLVQETWLAALRRPPSAEGSTRGWLGEVLRNARRMRGRRDGRRTRRESELERFVEPAAPSAEELLARHQASHRLSALVAELDEPIRTTVLLRYFEGLSAAEIARRQAVPAGTVRWRLSTGLDRLREALDRENGGERRRWAVLFVPLAGPPDATPLTLWKGIGIMTSTTKVGAAVTVAALAALAVGVGARSTPAKAKASATAVTAARAATVAPVAPAKVAPSPTRQDRDALRAQILEALRRRDAGLPPTRPSAPSVAPPAAAPASEPPRGHYEPSYIQEVFREEMFPLLRKCYEGALLQQPKLGGRLVLSFSIVGDPSVGGVVEDADIAEESSLQDEEMRTCVRESLMTLTFDKPPSGGGYVTVKYPVEFSPDDEETDAGDR